MFDKTLYCYTYHGKGEFTAKTIPAFEKDGQYITKNKGCLLMGDMRGEITGTHNFYFSDYEDFEGFARAVVSYELGRASTARTKEESLIYQGYAEKLIHAQQTTQKLHNVDKPAVFFVSTFSDRLYDIFCSAKCFTDIKTVCICATHDDALDVIKNKIALINPSDIPAFACIEEIETGFPSARCRSWFFHYNKNNGCYEEVPSFKARVSVCGLG